MQISRGKHRLGETRDLFKKIRDTKATFLLFSVPWETKKKKKTESSSHNQKQISLQSRSNINTASTSLSVGHVKVKVTQSCPTLVTPWTIQIVLRILQAGILEWVAYPFSRYSQPRNPAWAIREAHAERQGHIKTEANTHFLHVNDRMFCLGQAHYLVCSYGNLIPNMGSWVRWV